MACTLEMHAVLHVGVCNALTPARRQKDKSTLTLLLTLARRACGLAGNAPAPPRQCCGGSGMPQGERGPVSVDAHESADEGGRPVTSFAPAPASLMYAALSLSTSASPACQSASSIGLRGAPVMAGAPPSPPARLVLPARDASPCFSSLNRHTAGLY